MWQGRDIHYEILMEEKRREEPEDESAREMWADLECSADRENRDND